MIAQAAKPMPLDSGESESAINALIAGSRKPAARESTTTAANNIRQSKAIAISRLVNPRTTLKKAVSFFRPYTSAKYPPTTVGRIDANVPTPFIIPIISGDPPKART